MRRHTCSVFKKWLLFLLVIVSSLAVLFYNQPSLLSHPLRARRNPCFNAHWIILTKANLSGNMTCVATASGWTILIPSDVELEGYAKMVIRPDTVADMDESLLVRDPSRVNIPLYVAIRYGAHLIYRVSDLNSVLPNLETHFSEPFEHHLEATGNGMFNPYRHFGQPSIRPRGHPFSLGDQANIRYSISSEVSPHVIQVVNSRQLVIENPSEATSGQSVNVTLDARAPPVYLTSGKSITVTLDARAPPVYLTSGLWAPVNVMNTLFLNQSLWASVWPVSMSPPEADVIHGYWMQRLLWEIGGRMSFLAFDAGIHTITASQSPTSKPVNKTIAELLSFLEKWEYESGFTFFRCAEDISDRMAESGFWTKTDSAFVKSWLDFLRDRGYSEPSRKPTHTSFTPKLKRSPQT